MSSRMPPRWAGAAACWLACSVFLTAQPALRQLQESADAGHATIRVHADQPASFTIPKDITGKFAEHLGFNIYNGMDAQILHNPTFADYPFWTGQMSPDGVTKFYADEGRIDEELRHQAARFGWPEPELPGLIRARADGLAAFWTRMGGRENVSVSADTGPHGGRAQRVQVKAAGQGIAQWTWLPLHRQREYEIELLARSPDLPHLALSISRNSREQPVASVSLEGLNQDWHTLHGRFTLPEDLASDTSYLLALTSSGPGEFVVGHLFLRPSDHIGGADPDIVRLLKDAHLPLLRWPGGNFASTYHWQDGVGPVEQRPTKPNFAWGGIEPNTFGTDEFMAFCRAVGCEPMICINAGSGTPEEAARWIEYCNGPATSPMGRLRAANGHPEPYRVRQWEVGNELWGHWQMYWTTAAGYVDRYRRFSQAMLAADPQIKLFACGAPAMSGKAWNDTLISALGSKLPALTDHPLIGGSVPPSAEPLDVYRDFMAVPEILQQKWAALRDDMLQGGVHEPRLAVTELQLFAHIGRETDTNAPVRLTRDNLPNQASITEALYDVLVYHAAIRLGTFIPLVTHSAVVNHGGGLRKERERVWANPCYYAQAAFAAFGDGHPVPVEIQSTLAQAPMVLPDLKNAASHASFSAVDALGAVAPDGKLLLSVVNRSVPEPIQLRIELLDFKGASSAEVRTLSAKTAAAANTLEHPDLITPQDTVIPVQDGALELRLPPFSVLRVRIWNKP